MKKTDSLWKYADKKTGVWAAVYSCLTLFSVLAVCLPSWYEKLPQIDELVCGQVIWTGYAKQADLLFVKWILTGLPVLFLFFMGILCWNRKKQYLNQTECMILGGGYLACLVLGMIQPENGWKYGISFGVLVVDYLICRQKSSGREALQYFRNALYQAMLVTLLVMTGVLVLSFVSPQIAQLWQKCGGLMPGLFAVALLAFAVLREKSLAAAFKIRWVQAAFPFSLLGMVHFRYAYEAEPGLMELFYSGRWKLFCFLLAILLSAVCIWQLARRRQKLTVSTFAVVALLRVFTQPEGLLSIDFFHNGELSLPMQQLSSYGRLPYQGLVPIHGMCDYFFGALDVLFFDGSYLALNAAKVVGNMLMAIFLAVIIYYFVQSRVQGLLMLYFFIPYLIDVAGMRYLFLFAMFLILFSRRVRDGLWYLYAWILLSILATAWNASIGGAAAIAFVPVVLYRCIKFLPRQVKALMDSTAWQKVRVAAAWLLLFALGVAYIPMFLQIVEYLLDNTGTTLYVNGMEMFQEVAEASGDLVPGVWGPHDGFFLMSFGFVLPLLLCLYFAFEKEKGRAIEYLVSLLCCFFVLINYAFVRFDEGLRTTVMGVFFTLLILITLLYEKGEKAWHERDMRKLSGLSCCYLFGVFVTLQLADTTPWITSGTLSLVREIPAEIETTIRGTPVDDPVVYVTGDSVQMEGLGSGFVQGNTLSSLRNVQHVLVQQLDSDGTCLDITNEIAANVIFDRDNFWPFTSAYNISNERMQKKAIKMLSGNLPDMILAAPVIMFDEAPFSFRSPILYQYLMEQGYRAYKYENVIYLLRTDNQVEGAKEDLQSFAQLMHKKNLCYLPAIWGSSEGSDRQLQEIALGYRIEPCEEGFTIRFERPVDGDELTMLQLQLPMDVGKEGAVEKSADESIVTVSWKSSVAEEEEAVFEFYADDAGDSGTYYMIPLGLSPYFGMTDQITEIKVIYDTKVLQIRQSEISCSFGKLIEE